MKTIRETAEIFNISTQALYKKINTTLKDQISLHIHIKGNTKYIDDEGLQLVATSLQPVANQVVSDNDKASKLAVANQALVCNRFATKSDDFFKKPDEINSFSVDNQVCNQVANNETLKLFLDEIKQTYKEQINILESKNQLIIENIENKNREVIQILQSQILDLQNQVKQLQIDNNAKNQLIAIEQKNSNDLINKINLDSDNNKNLDYDFDHSEKVKPNSNNSQIFSSDEDIIRMLKNGDSYSIIAKTLRVGKSRIARIKKLYNL